MNENLYTYPNVESIKIKVVKVIDEKKVVNTIMLEVSTVSLLVFAAII